MLLNYIIKCPLMRISVTGFILTGTKSNCPGLSFRKGWKAMIVSDQQREENYEEYLQLLKDSNLSFASS